MKISLIENTKKDYDGRVKQAVLDAFSGKAEIEVCSSRVEKSMFERTDIAIVLGGDGTIIRTAKAAAFYGVPVFGINLGKIGFLAGAEVYEIPKMAQRILSGTYSIEKRMMLNVKVHGERGMKTTALNEIAITRASYLKMIDVSINVDGEFLDTFIADGAVISTPTGSTAYSLSAGGPVVEPGMELCLVTPICPYDMQSRSIILPANKQITFTIGAKTPFEALCSVDGQDHIKIHRGDKITVSKSNYYTQLITMGNRSFYSVLRKKLGKR